MKGRGAQLITLLVILAAAAVSRQAFGHVGPSDATNNRYYKLTPMADRVRLAYTIFFGRQPGQVMRHRMDVNRDGVLSSDEVSAYRQVIAKQLFASVSFLQAGKDAKLLWQDVDVGMDTMDVDSGPFSVDFIGTVCLDDRRLGIEHELVFRDRLRLPSPGETELSLAPAPGIQITKSVLDGRASRHVEKWQGGPGAAQTGYAFAFIVQKDELGPLDSVCTPPVATSSRRRLYMLGGGGIVLALLLAMWAWRSRRL